MNISEYKQLELNKRASILWENGTFIEDRIMYGKYKICTYSLFDFFVEVFYDIHDNSIKRINALEDEIDWKGYLDSINLDYLLR